MRRLRQLRAQKAAPEAEAASAGVAVAPASATEPEDVPLTSAQRRLWFLDQLESDRSIYNISGAHLLEDGLDEQLLERALNEVVRRHQALRTTFPAVAEKPVQRIAPGLEVRVPIIDLGSLAEPRRRREAERLAAEVAGRPFDLARGPLVRVTLVRLGGRRQALVLALHHIVADGWSMRVLNRELLLIYSALAAGQAPALPELGSGYADYAREQNRLEEAGGLEPHLEYWKEQLRDLPAALELPTDRPRPAVRGFAGNRLPFALAPAELSELQALARSEGKTLFMVLLAAFDVLLYRLTGQQDLVVGVPMANRDRLESEGLIGFFVNTLVLRTDLKRIDPAGDPTFRQILARVREVTLEAHAHQDLQFETLVEELQPERSLSRTPLFQVLFAYQNIPGGTGGGRAAGSGRAARGGRAAEPFALERKTALYDLSLNLDQTGDRAAGFFEYRTDIFDDTRIRRLSGHYRALLRAVAAQPDERLSRLRMLGPAQRQQVVLEWHDTGRGEFGAPMQEVFEQRFAPHADAAAVAWGPDMASGGLPGVLSYGELEARANQLAHHLRRLGLGAEERVAISLSRSPEMAIAVLGTLKAGGACLPLDPAYPAERLAFMTRDAGARVLLTDAASEQRLPPSKACVVRLDVWGQELEGEPRHAPTSITDQEHIFYVIYTSGSTGRPKGVALPHRCFSNLVPWHLEGHVGGVHTLQFASLSFDVSFYEMFTTWLSGGTLVLLSEDTRRDVPGVRRLVLSQRVAKATFPVVVIQQLAELARGGEPLPPTLIEVTSTGEQLKVTSAVRDLFAGHPAALHNHYGPSESHVVTAHALARSSAGWPSHPPIGRAVHNTRVPILDRRFRPVPGGVIGELYLSGVHLARGYLSRPALTAERFLPDPWDDAPGRRLYRTGDLAQHLADGTVEYLGRADHQIKIRGFRIEPAEIEAVLGEHPAVREAVVLAREADGDRRLVAYVVADRAPVDDHALRAHLAERLPDYMVPPSILMLEAFPLSPNGKVDRAALPAPEGRRASRRSVALDSPLEELVASVWGSVLGVEHLAADDNFFHLGGHSLLATRVISRLRDRCGVELELRQLFEAPTVAELARRLEQELKAGLGTIPPITPMSRDEAPRLSFSQERLWFLDQLDPGSPAYHLPTAVRLIGPLDTEALAAGLVEIARRHEALRTTFGLRDEDPVQLISDEPVCPLPVDDLSTREDREAELEKRIVTEVRRPFDLAADPPLRALLLRLGEEEHALVLTLHHIAGDGWSLEVLTRELRALYDAFSAGRPSPLPELAVQYADFAVWQRGWLAGEVLEGQLEYWRRQLGGDRAILELPTDRPRPRIQTFAGDRRSRPLGVGVSRAARALSREEGSTLFMTLLAVFDAVLHRMTGEGAIILGTPVANRTRSEIEGLIGFFVNTLALRVDTGGAPTFRQLLTRVRETTLEAYAHQDLPFEKLVAEIEPERNLSHTPLLQVLFQLHNSGARATAENDPSSLRFENLPVDLGAAKLDLTLAVNDLGDGLAAGVEFNTDLFDATTMKRLLGHFGALLEAATADPDRAITDLPMLRLPEARQLQVEWNDTGVSTVDAPGAQTLSQLVEAQAAPTPGADAVIDEDRRMSYAELNRRANQLARELRAMGVGPEQLVGVLLERSTDLVVAILGALKAGAAYLPLDPAYPRERLAFMLADARAPVVITQKRFLELVAGQDAEVLSLDVVGHRLAGHSGDDLGVATHGDHLAYAIYTSGSTGRPKGVAIAHRNALAMVRWARQAFTPEQRAGMLACTSVCFDLSVFEIFVPLAWGSRLILAENALHLPSLPAASEVTLVNTVPSAIAELLSGGHLPDSVTTVNLAGEPLRRDLVEGLYALGHVRGVYNLYGPSEDTTYSTYGRIRPGRPTPPSIGGPVGETRGYVVDPGMRPLPLGIPGELYLGGAGVARGYLGRPGLTAGRFVPDPFADIDGQRLYRTGDLVRARTDGRLQFLGRADHQIKLRGFRIELGEIEVLLRRHPAIADTAVVVKHTAELPQLVAYVVAPEGGEPPTPEELRSYLGEKLPVHMVPSLFVALDALPLLANGKIDRSALSRAETDVSKLGSAAVYEAPRTATERLVAGVWQDVLRLPRVGAEDNFFELGGHSLLMVRAYNRLKKAVDPALDFPLIKVFEHPTVSALARFIDRGAEATSGSRQRGQERGDRRRRAQQRRRRRRRR